jgi:DNA-binding NarL/FixJ family response regulator
VTTTWSDRALNGIRSAGESRAALSDPRIVRVPGLVGVPLALTALSVHALAYNRSSPAIWVLALATVWLLVLRDRLPLVVAAGCLGGAIALVVADVDNPGALAALVALFAVVVRSPRGAVIAVAAAALCAGAAAALRFGPAGSVDDAMVGGLAAVVGTIGVGCAVRAQHSRIALLENRASQLRAESRRPDALLDSSDPRHPLAALSRRERDVFQLLVRGMSNAEIAATLFLSETTIKSHVTHVLAKLQLRDRVHVVIFAHERGLASRTGSSPE